MAGSDNRLKTPLSRSLNQLSGQRASDASQSMAKGIPAQVVSRDGQLVTVAFQMQVGGVGGPWTLVQATYPIATSSLDWLPLNKGTNGLLLPSDFYLGGVSGQGGGTADFAQRGNLASLQFHPISHKSWQPPGGDTDFRIVQGPNGVLIQTMDGKDLIKVSKTKITILVQAGQTVEVGAGGTLQSVKLADGSNSTVLKAQ